jgi:hypothetical protein
VAKEKKGDKGDKAATPEKGKKGTTIRPASTADGEDPKSPRNNGPGFDCCILFFFFFFFSSSVLGSLVLSFSGFSQFVAGNESAAPTEDVMVFSLGDVKLALTHRKLLQDSHFFDLEYVLGGGKKSAPTRAHRAVIQVRCPALLQEGKFIAKIDKKKPMW